MRSLFKKIIVYVNAIFIVALLIAYISIYINPQKFWMPAFFGLGYPFILTVNILFVVFWIYKKKREFLYSLIAILIGWNFLTSFFQLPSKESKQIEGLDDFKVLSYNVRLFNLYNWADNENADHEILDLINKEDPDIVCLQEYYVKRAGDFTQDVISEKLKSAKYEHIVHSISKSSYDYGIATYSKYPIVKRGVINFEHTSNISIYTDIRIQDDTVRVFNNHLQSIRFDKRNYSFIKNSKDFEDEERIEEIKDISYRLRDAFIKRSKQVEILTNHISKSPHPVLICGDFNDTPVSYTYKQIKGDLKDAFLESGRWLGNTYVGNFPSYRIDFVLHSDELQSLDFRIPRVKLSDHYPVVSKLYFAE